MRCSVQQLQRYGGLEATLLNLITPMLHQGMIIAGLPGNISENALYGTYYGVGITCPIEGDELLTENDQALGKALERTCCSSD